MPPRIRLVFTSLSLVLFFVAAVPLYGALFRRSDIWWTPHAMLVPLAESTDRVEIYARGKPLAALLQAGQLRIAEEGGSSTLATRDVGLRFNNWDRVRVERLPLLLVYAAGCGVTACMLLLVLTGRLAYRGERER
jgi:predicted xylose isomerase-like sugar epimerase